MSLGQRCGQGRPSLRWRAAGAQHPALTADAIPPPLR